MGPTIWRQRQRVNVLFPIPEENDTFFNIPHKYQITSNRNEFLQTDWIIDDDKIFLFGTGESIQFILHKN